MNQLVPCPECSRHVRVTETECPFCALPLDLAGTPEPQLPKARLSRAATFAFGATLASATALAAACGGEAETTGGNAGSNNTGAAGAASAGAAGSRGGAGGSSAGMSGAGGTVTVAPPYGLPPDPPAGGSGGTDGGGQAVYGGPPQDMEGGGWSGSG
jgi:hypothetical protein